MYIPLNWSTVVICWVRSFPLSSLFSTDLNVGAFLRLCTNLIATAGLSYRIWVETGHDNGLSAESQARVRRVALGLIETGSIYLAVQLSYTVTTSITWYQLTHGSGLPPVDSLWAWSVTNALSTMIPVRFITEIPILVTMASHQSFILGNSGHSHCRQNQY